KARKSVRLPLGGTPAASLCWLAAVFFPPDSRHTSPRASPSPRLKAWKLPGLSICPAKPSLLQWFSGKFASCEWQGRNDSPDVAGEEEPGRPHPPGGPV